MRAMPKRSASQSSASAWRQPTQACSASISRPNPANPRATLDVAFGKANSPSAVRAMKASACWALSHRLTPAEASASAGTRESASTTRSEIRKRDLMIRAPLGQTDRWFLPKIQALSLDKVQGFLGWKRLPPVGHPLHLRVEVFCCEGVVHRLSLVYFSWRKDSFNS